MEVALPVASWLMGGAALLWLAALLSGFRPAGGAGMFDGLLAAGVVLVQVGQSLRRYRHWTISTRQLVALLPRVQGGELPIDALTEIRGGAAAVVPAVVQLLHQLRQDKAERAKLEHETRQRVANRTDALEREVGSLRQQATRDPLTGLFNRRLLESRVARAIERRKADKGRLCLLMMDVDHFKPLNDTLGHAAGDELLRNIGQIIRSSIRESDAAFRCGGDEFVVLLDGCDAESARRLAARLSALVDALARPLKLAWPPGLSIGVSQLSDLADPTAVAFLKEADRLLYEAKSSRRGAR